MIKAFLKKVALLKYALRPEGKVSKIPRRTHGISRKQISVNALKVLYRLNRCGYQAYLVGGGIRDLLLGLHPKDFDVVTDARPEEIKAVFRNCRLIGRRFRLAHVYFGYDIVEVATFRGKGGSDTTHRHSKEGVLLHDNVYGSLEEDVWRRDFTVNALYYNIVDFSLVDYVGGWADLHARRLKMIGEPSVRYREDPVRMLRAVRYACKTGFPLPKALVDPLIALKALIQEVAPARLYVEVVKIFYSGVSSAIYQKLKQYGLFEELFPATAHNAEGADLLSSIVFGDADARVLENKTLSPAFLFAALLWKPLLSRIASYTNESSFQVAYAQASEEILQEQLRRLSMPRRIVQDIREIWTLQRKLERCHRRQVVSLPTFPRFRAALDLLILREKAGEPVQALVVWWQEYTVADPQQKQRLMRKLPRKGRR